MDADAKPTVYIETTIVSYLTARPTRSPVRARDQSVTRDWWDTRRARFEVLTSEVTILEASAGDPEAAARRLAALDGVRLLNGGEGADRLAGDLIRATALPIKAGRDALHIAVAATNGIAYLLTWNCTHMANDAAGHKIRVTCAAAGFRAPTLCTPRQLFEEFPDEPPP